MTRYPALLRFPNVVLVTAVAAGLLLSPAIASAQPGSVKPGSAKTSTPQYIGTGAGIYTDDGDLDGLERTDVLEEDDQSFSFDSHNSIVGSIWYLRQASESIRWGGGLRYYGSYEVLEVPDDEDNDDEFQPYELGQLTNFYMQGEWLVRFSGDKALILGAQIGPSLLVPDGEFQQEIDQLKDDGVDVWDTPRVGYHVAPQIGALWELDDRLSIRTDLGVRYENLFLFAVDDNVDGVTKEKTWTTSVLRYEFGLAMEVQL
jgi:hypothetical protein